jgi:hypothetical protein
MVIRINQLKPTPAVNPGKGKVMNLEPKEMMCIAKVQVEWYLVSLYEATRGNYILETSIRNKKSTSFVRELWNESLSDALKAFADAVNEIAKEYHVN